MIEVELSRIIIDEEKKEQVIVLKEKKGKFDLARFGKSLPEELTDVLSRFSLLDLEKLLKDTARRDREIIKAISELEKIDLRERMKEISDEIGKLEADGKELLTLQWMLLTKQVANMF